MRTKVKLLSIIYLICNFITTGCSFDSIPTNKSIDYSKQSNSFKQATSLLANLTSQTDITEKQEILLSAAEKYIDANLTNKTHKIVKSIDKKQLNTNQLQRLSIINAKIHLNNNDSKQALKELFDNKTSVNISNSLDSKNKEQIHELTKIALDKIQLDIKNESPSDFYQQVETEDNDNLLEFGLNNQSENEIDIRLELGEKLNESPDLSDYNKKNIWHKIISNDRDIITKNINITLDKINNAKLSEQNNNYTDLLEFKKKNTDLLSWLEIGKISKQRHIDSSEYINQVSQWKNNNPNHPALSYFQGLSESLNSKSNSKEINKITVLLPLSGTLAPAAKAIKEGILFAYYSDRTSKKPKINFIDTHNDVENIEKYYNQAVKQNPDLILGPLNKKSVYKIKDIHNPSIPIVALNYISNDVISSTYSDSNRAFFQFGISGEDEAEQTAYKVWKNGLKNSLLIVDNNEWGERVGSSFINKYENLGGNISAIAKVDRKTDLKKLIYSNLGTDKSQNRKNVLQWIIGQKLSFTPRYRQDFDNIILLTSDIYARQIKPILKFYYADSIPILATSNILTFTKNNKSNLKDLEGIQVCDIPLTMHDNKYNKEILKQLAKTWPENYESFIRLYALGIDAYNLKDNLSIIQALPNLGVAANTGHILLDNDNRISRVLPWGQIKNSEIKVESTL